MSIYHFCSKPSEVPADAKIATIYCPVARGHYAGDVMGPNRMIIYTTHHGLCIKEREVNMRDDSDFYMTVWNEEKQEPESIMFATTRGWTYPCMGSFVDATPEVLEKYKAWETRKYQEHRALVRRTEAQKAHIFRNKLRDIAKEYDVPYPRLLTLAKNVGRDHVLRLVPLFGPKVRSEFKISLRNHVIKWLRDPNPKYRNPLSFKQWSYV